MVKLINDSYKINADYDHENIIKFVSPRNVTTDGSLDLTSTYYKGFQIAKNIWVVPHRYVGNGEDEKENGGVYDSTYLRAPDEQQKFLDDMILLFKRINSTEFGRSFLSLLTAAVPFPKEEIDGKTQEKRYNGTNYLLDIDTDKFLGMNIIIYGPCLGSSLMDFKAMALNKENASNGIGTTVEICFTPQLTFQYEGMIQDPALSLWQQLIYAMHMLYGIKIPEEQTVPYEAIYTGTFPVSYSKIACEKLLVAGGQDYKYASKLRQWPYDYFQKTKGIITTTKIPLIEEVIKKQVHPNGSIPEEFYKCLQKKYNIDPQVIWNITMDKCASNLGIVSPPQSVFQNDFSFNSLYFEVEFPPEYITQGIQFEKTDQFCKKTTRPIFKEPIEISDFLYQDKNGEQKKYSVNLYNLNYSDVSVDCYKEMEIDATINNNDNEISVMENLIDEIDSIDYYGNDFIDSIDQINSIIFDIPSDVSVSKIEKKNLNKFETKNNQEKMPLFEHYLKTQREIIESIDSSNRKKITLTNSFIEAIENRDQQFAYSPFVNFSKDINPPNEQQKSESTFELEFYSWIKQIAKSFKKDVELIQLTNEIMGVPFIISWLNPDLKNLNDNLEKQSTTDSLLNLINTLLPNNISKFVIPAVNGLELESLIKILKDIPNDQIIDIILKIRESQWKQIYGVMTHQWWTTYDLQFRKVIYQMRESLYYQMQIALNNCYYYLNTNKTLLENDIQNQNKINKAIESLKERMSQSAQKALENVTQFLLNCSISFLKNKILPNVLEKLKNIDEQSSDTLKAFCSALKEDSLKEELINQFDQNITTEIPFDITVLPTMLRLNVDS